MATVDAKLAKRLVGELDADLVERDPGEGYGQDGRIGLVRRYLRGDQDLPYMPRGAKAEYKRLAQESVTNWLGLVSDTFVKGLFVDGYRAPKSGDNTDGWAWFVENRLAARQGIVHRGAIEYGAAYGLVLPGKGSTPAMTCMSPTRSMAWYADDDDEFPELGLRVVGETVDGTKLYDLFDKTSAYRFARNEDDEWSLLGNPQAHGLKVTPFVRWRDRLDGEAVGMIRPLIRVQDRLNEVVFSTMIALQYASFRQRWATGLAIPEDEDGKPVEPFQAAVDRLWISDDPEAKFGEFGQTDTNGHRALYTDTVKTLAALAQISPNVLTGDLVNLSGDALAQLEQSTQRKLGELETLFGESWETFFALGAQAAGTKVDTSAQVRWRDTEARSLAQTVDALGKQAQMLQVPVEALWEKIPGVTDTDITYWKELRQEGNFLTQLGAELDKQTSTDTPAPETPAAA